MEEIDFTKMHGAGNDYIYIYCPDAEPSLPQSLAREMSDRHTGVGSDGLILILPSDKADFRMRMFNADGSEGSMCGNASRCIAKFIHDRRLIDPARRTITLETLAGIRTLRLNLRDSGEVESVTVDMGCPEIVGLGMALAYSGGTIEVNAVSMGNPHAVCFIDRYPTDTDVLVTGRELETHPAWPDRSNIEFARVVDDATIDMRVWERGSGETLACGTGACATAVAAAALRLTGREVDVRLKGGTLHIVWDTADGHVFMTGPAVTVMDGRYYRKEKIIS